MVNQNKIFSFKIMRQAKNVLPSDVERTVGACLTRLYINERLSILTVSKLLDGYATANSKDCF